MRKNAKKILSQTENVVQLSTEWRAIRDSSP